MSARRVYFPLVPNPCNVYCYQEDLFCFAHSIFVTDFSFSGSRVRGHPQMFWYDDLACMHLFPSRQQLLSCIIHTVYETFSPYLIPPCPMLSYFMTYLMGQQIIRPGFEVTANLADHSRLVSQLFMVGFSAPSSHPPTQLQLQTASQLILATSVIVLVAFPCVFDFVCS